MKNEIVKQNNIGQLSESDLKQLELANIIPKGTPAPQVQIFATICKEKSLSPFQKQIYLLPFNQKVGDKWETHYACIVGIDGYRTIAERTNKYAGSDDAKFNDDKTEFQCRKEGMKNPETATVTIYKVVSGQRAPFTATAGWLSYLPANEKKQFSWKRMPFLMLAKTAEALALRKAFPEALSGLHSEEESGGFENIQDAEEIKKVDISANILIKYKSKFDEFQKYVEFQKSGMELVEKAIKEGINDDHLAELKKYVNELNLKLKKEAIEPKGKKGTTKPKEAQESKENTPKDDISDEAVKSQMGTMPETEQTKIPL